MKYKYFIFGLLSVLISVFTCFVVHAKKVAEVSYTSTSSSTTKIKLNLYANGKFSLLINIFGDRILATKSEGRWYKKDGYYVLTFKNRTSPALITLFPNTSLNNNVEIVNDDTFKFKTDLMELYIYAVKCIRGSLAQI